MAAKKINNVVIFVSDKGKLNENELAGLVGLSTSEMKISVLDGGGVVPMPQNIPEELSRFLRRYSSLTLLKALIPVLFKTERFKDCENILWMDCDMLPLSSIDSLFNFADDNFVAACLGAPAIKRLKNPDLFPKILPTDIKPNGGLILWNRKTADGIDDPEEFISGVYDYAIKLATSNNDFIDEFSVLFASKILGANFRLLPQIYNQVPDNYNPSTVIVHSVGSRRKFWDNEIVNLMYSQWENANHIWLQQLLKVGVSYEDLPKYNKSKFGIGSRKKHIDGASWRTFWLSKYQEMKFQHPSVYLYPDVSADTIVFISLKKDGLRFLLKKERNSFAFSVIVAKTLLPAWSLLSGKYEITEREQVVDVRLIVSGQEKGEILAQKMTQFIDDINAI